MDTSTEELTEAEVERLADELAAKAMESCPREGRRNSNLPLWSATSTGAM